MGAWVRNNRILLVSVGALLAAVVCVFVYIAPLSFPAALRRAAANRDTIRLEQLIDFPAVREGLKGDLNAQLSAVVPQPASAVAAAPPASTGAAGVAQALAGAVIDQIVDQTVTPQGVEEAVANTPAATPAPGAPLLDGLFPKSASGGRFRVEHRYLALGRFRYTLTAETGKSSVDIDLERQGLFGWRVERVTPNLDLSSLRVALAAFAPQAQQPQQQDTSQTLTSAPPPPPPPPIEAALPTQVGQCADTAIKEVSTRLDGVADSGSAVSFADGGYQVSYDQVPAVDQSRAGDPINLCLVTIPDDCPPGDDRGKTYKATNMRTGESWTLPDSEHMCGGA